MNATNNAHVGSLRHSFRCLLKFARAIWLGFVVAISVASTASAQPNIVFIVSDDAGYNDFGFMADYYNNATDIETPNLDALAQQSVLMPSAYVAAAVCSPSRAGFLTGRYGQRIGYEDNPGSANGLPAGQQLMSHRLQDLGYTTGAIGKWHLGEIDGVNRPLDMGFDEFYGFFGGGRPFWGLNSTDSGRTMRRGDAIIESQWDDQGDTSQYDPVNGRYLTDAFGEEAVDFINNHANDENPFFLYASFNAPHTPLDSKQVDLDHFAHITDPSRRAVAAMTYALDRAVGNITGALSANGLDDETIVVFMNDNGGPSTAPHSNYPLRGNKGSLWEGGIRVPMMISAPGLAAGVYDEPVSSLDLLPTFVNAAGGNSDAFDTDGTDLMPFLTGEIAGDPHELMFWRGVDGRFAVRKGDWKLVRPSATAFARLHDVVDDIDESSYVNSEHPEVVQELLRELTYWEATLHKAKWGPLGAARNQFDHFVLRNDVAASAWSTASAWHQGGSTQIATLRNEDAYANAILEFGTRDDADYTSTNDMWRATNQNFMLNQIRLTGTFAGNANRTGTINGNPLLLVKDLNGVIPQIRTDATAGSTSVGFTFHLDNDLYLLHDLVIFGNGTQNFVVDGDIHDYWDARNVVKAGTSTVTLAGANTFKGSLFIAEGRVKTSNLAGNVEIGGGIFAPGGATMAATIGGDFSQTNGTLEIEIGGVGAGTQFDTLAITGSASLGGTLHISLINGFVPSVGQIFEFLTADGDVTGAFDAITYDNFDDKMFIPLYGTGSVALLVALNGDYDGNGVVDAADYVLYRKGSGAAYANYSAWRNNYGNSVGAGSSTDLGPNGASVPEPSTVALLILAITASLMGQRRR